jgi:beta-lactamase superfamily II metal-dependent hydrolase
VFVLTHEPPDPAVTFLTGDIMEAAATALDAAGGRTSKSSVLTWPVSACSGAGGRDLVSAISDQMILTGSRRTRQP